MNEEYGSKTKNITYKGYDIKLIFYFRGVDAFISKTVDDTFGKDEETATQNAKRMIDYMVSKK